MPIDKSTGEKICINGCGLLEKNILNEPNLLAFAIPSIRKFEKDIHSIDLRVCYTLNIWVCSKCGYLEFYDFDIEKQ